MDWRSYSYDRDGPCKNPGTLGTFGKHAFTYKRGHGPVGRPLKALSGKFYSTNEKNSMYFVSHAVIVALSQ